MFDGTSRLRRSPRREASKGAPSSRKEGVKKHEIEQRRADSRRKLQHKTIGGEFGKIYLSAPSVKNAGQIGLVNCAYIICIPTYSHCLLTNRVRVADASVAEICADPGDGRCGRRGGGDRQLRFHMLHRPAAPQASGRGEALLCQGYMTTGRQGTRLSDALIQRRLGETSGW